MAHTRVEEVFVANHVVGNNNTLGVVFPPSLNLQTQSSLNAFQTLSNSIIHNVVGLMNADNNTLILNSANLASAENVRFWTTHKNRRVRYSDLINRRKITRITTNNWRLYQPIVYRLDFSGIASALAGDHLVLGFRLRHEEDFTYRTIFVEHTFRATGSGADVVEIVNKINEVSTRLSRKFRPFKAFTGNAIGNAIDFNAPNSGNLFIYIIAGKRELDRQNIVQLDIYDFDVLLTSSYKASTKITANGSFAQIIPTFTLQKGTVGISGYTYNSDYPITYDDYGDPISQIVGSAFNSVTVATTPKPQDSNGFYEDIITNIYQNDLGQVLGHNNRIWLPDQVELPNIIRTVQTVGAGLDLTNRYNSIHIEYESEAIDSTQQNQNQRKNKRFTLYVNASLYGSGLIFNVANYNTSNWTGTPDGLQTLINNLPL